MAEFQQALGSEKWQSWTDSVRNTLERESGRSLEVWVALVRAEMPADVERPRQRLQWLKETYGILQNRGIMILTEAFPGSYGELDTDANTILETHFNANAHLRPLFDRVVEAAHLLGQDVAVTPQKSFISLVRKYKFAQLKPGKKGLLLGLALDKNEPLPVGFSAPRMPDRINAEIWLQPDSPESNWLPYLRAAYERS